MEDIAPALGVLVGREDHRAVADVSVVDDVIEDAGCVVGIREVTDFVDDKDVRLHVAGEGVTELAVVACGGELVARSAVAARVGVTHLRAPDPHPECHIGVS